MARASIPEMHMKYSHGLEVSLEDTVYSAAHQGTDSELPVRSPCFSHSDSQKSTADESSYKVLSFHIWASLLGTHSEPWRAAQDVYTGLNCA